MQVHMESEYKNKAWLSHSIIMKTARTNFH